MVIAKVIDYCHKEKLIDHNDFANSLKNTMILTTDKGPGVYKQKLHQSGIEKSIIDEYGQLYEAEQPLEDILKLANKIWNQKRDQVLKEKKN